MSNDDPFRNWLAETKKYADDNWDPTLIDVLDDVIDAYDALKAAAATGSDDDTPEASYEGYPHDKTIRSVVEDRAERDWQQYLAGFKAYAGTDDPRDDHAAYDAAMDEYQGSVALLVATALVFDPENRDVMGKDIRERSNTVARHIAALPKPVKGGER